MPQWTHLLPFPVSPSPFKNNTLKKEFVERRHSCVVVMPSHASYLPLVTSDATTVFARFDGTALLPNTVADGYAWLLAVDAHLVDQDAMMDSDTSLGRFTRALLGKHSVTLGWKISTINHKETLEKHMGRTTIGWRR